MNLKTSVSRTDLTVIYLHWNEQKKKIVACVADLKAHLVKQVQVCTHLLPLYVYQRDSIITLIVVPYLVVLVYTRVVFNPCKELVPDVAAVQCSIW